MIYGFSLIAHSIPKTLGHLAALNVKLAIPTPSVCHFLIEQADYFYIAYSTKSLSYLLILYPNFRHIFLIEHSLPGIMIEKLVDAILTSEKYTVRLLDEVAHKLINKPVKYFEQNGIPRNKQALYLDLMTLFGTLNAAFIWSRQDFNYAKAHALKLPVWAVLLGVSFFDADKLKYSRNTQNQGGVLSNPEVVSYNSISGIIRPYMLASSIGSIIYGLYNNNYDFLESGMIVLPLSLSFYVRDSSSGGLLKHASQLIRNSIISRVPSA